jgi:hypothetical protein
MCDKPAGHDGVKQYTKDLAEVFTPTLQERFLAHILPVVPVSWSSTFSHRDGLTSAIAG